MRYRWNMRLRQVMLSIAAMLGRRRAADVMHERKLAYEAGDADMFITRACAVIRDTTLEA